ncbi:MAG TPA: neutral/alkaline non-lysosomal ceramidase N-terminal domain-containing protein [Gemmataceae bacterium]|nr:neutral/alkaline non-lysosomal ceramidase N-terminal domain-containing protein [Gemmataceae bacterium]
MDLPWKAGVAKTVITPTEPMWLAGWAVRTEPARGKLTDLFAKGLAVEDSHGGRFVLLTADLIAIPRDITDAVALEAQRRWQLPRERVMVCASHTHSGPEIRPDKVPFFHIPPEFAAKIGPYRASLTGQLIDLVGRALTDLQPTRLFVRQTTAGFAHNRRNADEVDHDVPVLEVTAAEGHRRAVVFGYACHNTTMPPDDYRYCGDYAGITEAAFESGGTGVSPVVLFLAGAGADQDPEPRDSLALTRRHSETLAAAVRDCLGAPGTELTGPLRAVSDDISLDFQPLPPRGELQAAFRSDESPMRTKAGYLLDRLDRGEPLPTSYPCPLQAARFGDGLLLIAIGGEPVVDYAHELKRRYSGPGRIVWVTGYANDMFGYVPSAAVLRGGGYEGTRSLLWSALPAPFAENTEQRLLDGIDRLVQQVGWG